MIYLLDSDVFIRAKNLHYGFDFCPAFWEWLVIASANGRVFSVEKVGDELEDGSDELSTWAAMRGSDFFLRQTPETIAAFDSVERWVRDYGYEHAAIETFLQIADSYLVAHALAYGHIVVTHEKASNSKRRIKIPDVCGGFGVEIATPFEMLRREGARFVLGASA